MLNPFFYRLLEPKIEEDWEEFQDIIISNFKQNEIL
jgi:hypothetical protein